MFNVYFGGFGFNLFDMDVIIFWFFNYIWVDIIFFKFLLNIYLKISRVYRLLKNGINVLFFINFILGLIC